MLSAEHVRRIARLARLAIPDERIERYRSDLAAVLGYADRLRALPLEGVEPMASPIDAPARLDDDVPGPSLPTAVLMEMAPETAGPFVKVPKVIGEGA
jgi:aspartyl-tRNA(Asn)/glutamyl-tRNA(Gln) amidotransferase subunit C